MGKADTPPQVRHDGQKSYAGEWDDDPKTQPPSVKDQAPAEIPERPIAVPPDNIEGERDENVIGDNRAKSGQEQS